MEDAAMSNQMAQMQKILAQIQEAQQQIQHVQEELETKTVTEESGGGLVKATVNGKHELMALKIEKEALADGDIEMLEDLIIAAVNKAIRSASQMMQQEMGNATRAAMPNLPNIPGLDLGNIFGE